MCVCVYNHTIHIPAYVLKVHVLGGCVLNLFSLILNVLLFLIMYCKCSCVIVKLTCLVWDMYVGYADKSGKHPVPSCKSHC